MKKSILKSKTLWINILLALVVIIPELANLPDLKIKKEYFAIVVLIINTILRLITKEPVSVLPKSD